MVKNNQEHMATECMNCIQHKQNVIEAYSMELQILELLDHFKVIILNIFK